jgi:hypothetical protein
MHSEVADTEKGWNVTSEGKREESSIVIPTIHGTSFGDLSIDLLYF